MLRMRSRRRRADEGSALVVGLLASGVLAVVLMSALAELGGTVVDRTRARTAADAVALAGVVGGAAEAARLAELNGAVLVSFRQEAAGAQVTVVVEIDGVSAMARATDAP